MLLRSVGNLSRPVAGSQFHQHSMCSFYVRKLHAQLFCACSLGLYFTGARLLAQKLQVERWWNWALLPGRGPSVKIHCTRAHKCVALIFLKPFYLPKIIPKEVYLAISEEGGTVPERIHSATICVTDISDFNEFVRRYSSNDVRCHWRNAKQNTLYNLQTFFSLQSSVISQLRNL